MAYRVDDDEIVQREYSYKATYPVAPFEITNSRIVERT